MVSYSFIIFFHKSNCLIILTVTNLEGNFRHHRLRVPDYFRVSFMLKREVMEREGELEKGSER